MEPKVIYEIVTYTVDEFCDVSDQIRGFVTSSFIKAKEYLDKMNPSDYFIDKIGVASINRVLIDKPMLNNGTEVYSKSWEWSEDKQSYDLSLADYSKLCCYCGWEGYITDFVDECCPKCKTPSVTDIKMEVAKILES